MEEADAPTVMGTATRISWERIARPLLGTSLPCPVCRPERRNHPTNSTKATPEPMVTPRIPAAAPVSSRAFSSGKVNPMT
jgi:hypothetical protein